MEVLPEGRRTFKGAPKVHRVFLVPGHLSRREGTRGGLHWPEVGRQGSLARYAPIDSLNRSSFMKDTGGLGYCNITKCCQEVCPEHIIITDDAIIPEKERVVDR